jgi:ABC-type sugar transport system permease subunit
LSELGCSFVVRYRAVLNVFGLYLSYIYRMIYLLFCILSSTAIAVIFKLMANRNIEILPVIVINYFTALITGLLMFNSALNIGMIVQSEWLNISLLIGVFLIVGFYLTQVSHFN